MAEESTDDAWADALEEANPATNGDAPAAENGGGEDWDNRYSPFAVLGDVDPDPTFWEWEVNPVYRIPLIGLVYHDCILTTWNWRGSNHRWKDGWRHKDLMNILFGNMPMWSLDETVWKRDKDKLVESYKNFSPTLKAVMFEDMVDHRWLSEDKKVAMVSYANGFHVAVNFTEKPFEYEGKTIAPLSHIIWKE